MDQYLPELPHLLSFSRNEWAHHLACSAVLSVWAINGTPQITLQLINTNTVSHHFLPEPAEPLGHLLRLKMWEAKLRGHQKLQKVHQV